MSIYSIFNRWLEQNIFPRYTLNDTNDAITIEK